LLVYDNTAHRHGFRVVAHFMGGGFASYNEGQSTKTFWGRQRR
jgi:hypothetical protein